MKSIYSLSAALALLLAILPVCAKPGFTDAASIKQFLHNDFTDTNAAIVIGLVDKNGSEIFTAGTLNNGITNSVDADSVFLIGSVTKTFTVLLLQDMVERGEMRLDDPVAKYLPASVQLPTHGGKQITLLDLAAHTAGLPFNPEMSGKDTQEQYESFTVEKMYAFLAKYQLTRDPGTEFEYSNLGSSLLGHAIALKAGTNFESLVVDRICRPLHMDHTRLTLSPEAKFHLAMAHDDAGKPCAPWKLQALAPAGGILSTANDLLKYAAAHAGLTSSPLTPLMERTHVIRHRDSHGLPDIADKNFFGNTAMAWTDRSAYQPPGMELLGHAGGAGGYHAWVGFDKKQHRGVVVLSTASKPLSVEAVGWTVLQGFPLTRETSTDVVREIVGLGIALELSPTQEVRISKVFRQSSAEVAGLTPGLLIQKINTTPTAGKTLAQCLELLRTNIDGKVQLELLTPDRTQTNHVQLTRQKFLTMTGPN